MQSLAICLALFIIADEFFKGHTPWRANAQMNQQSVMWLTAALLTIGNPAFANSNAMIPVPLVRQSTNYTCGVAALQAILAFYGEDVREDVLSKALRAQRNSGTRYRNIAEYARHHGYTVEISKRMSIEKLKEIVYGGQPVICLIQAWPDKKVDFKTDWKDGHYVIAVGADSDKIIFMDPSTVGHYTYIPTTEFLERWHDVDGKEKLEHFGMTIWKESSRFNSEKLEPMN